MRLIASVVLLVLAGFALFQSTWAGFAQISLDSLEKLKISDDWPEAPVQVQEEIFESEVYADSKGSEEGSNNLPENVTRVEKELSAGYDATSECVVNIRSGLTNPQPVFLVTGEDKFYPFSESGNMQVPAGQTMQLFCPGQFKSFAKTLITATCENGYTFSVNGKSYKFSELVCKSWPSFVARTTDSGCEGGTLLQIGFKVSPTRFVEQMQICFNEEEEVTRYVYHTLQPGSNFYQTGVERLTFHTNGFFGGKNVDKLYGQKSQMEIINKDLGSEENKYFDSSKNIFLARGHLSAKADWMYGSQQRATFSFINVAPQWQVFNAGNWARIEDGLRAWVSKNKINVSCYTGVYGVTTLPNKEGHETPLYLARDANNNGLIPVPKLYFRVVIEPATEKGIVFIGVNNPHLSLERIKKDYIVCQDISDKVNYIKWKKRDIQAGYSYACEVSDFMNAVENLPPLSARGGLLI